MIIPSDRDYLVLNSTIFTPRSKARESLSSKELFATYIKRHNDIFNAPEAERSSPIRMPDDIIGTRNRIFPLPSNGSVSTNVQNLFKSSGIYLDEISGENELRKQKLAAGSRLSVVFAVLSTPSFIYSRLLPLLTTSLRDQSSVHVFYRKTNISHLAVKEVNSQLKIFHDRFMRGSVSAPFDPERVKVAEINGPSENYIKIPKNGKNSWMNMQIIKYLGDHYSAIPFQSRAGEKSSGLEAESMQNGGRKDNPFSRWFCLVDDDGYVIVPNAEILLENATRYIGKVIANKTPTTYKERLGISRPLVVGWLSDFVVKWSVLVNSDDVPRDIKFLFTFVQGGCGMFLNQAALEAIYPSNVWTLCTGKYIFGGGDIRLSACLLEEGGATALGTKSMFHKSPLQALMFAARTKSKVNPVSFHRIRNYKWFLQLRQIEHLRSISNSKTTNKGKHIMVSWDDIFSIRGLFRQTVRIQMRK